MSLDELIRSHDECLNQLLSAINADNDHELINRLDSQIKLLSNSIRDIHLSAAKDINRQIKFFLNRTASVGDETITLSDRQTVELLVDRYTNEQSSPQKLSQKDLSVDIQASVKLREHRFVTDELIVQSNSRVALFNLDYKYEYTSLGNARFHETDPASFVGRHVVDFIGEQRFSKRAKPYYDRCFTGENQNYSYFLEVSDQGERLMDCQLTPYRDSDGCVRGAFFTVEDITDKIEHATRSALSNQIN